MPSTMYSISLSHGLKVTSTSRILRLRSVVSEARFLESTGVDVIRKGASLLSFSGLRRQYDVKDRVSKDHYPADGFWSSQAVIKEE